MSLSPTLRRLCSNDKSSNNNASAMTLDNHYDTFSLQISSKSKLYSVGMKEFMSQYEDVCKKLSDTSLQDKQNESQSSELYANKIAPLVLNKTRCECINSSEAKDKKIEETEERMKKMESDLEEEKERVVRFQTIVEEEQRQRESKEEDIIRLKTELSNQETEKVQLKTKLEDMVAEAMKRREVEREMELLKASLKEAREKNQWMEKEMQEMRVKHEKNEKEREEKTEKEKEEKEGRIASLFRELLTARMSKEETENRLSKEIKVLSIRLAEKEEEIDGAKKEKEQWMQKAKSMETEKRKLETDKRRAFAQIKRLTEEKKAEEQKRKEEEGEKESLESQIHTLHRDLFMSLERQEEAIVENQNLMKEVYDLKTELGWSCQRETELVDTVTDLRAALDQTTAMRNKVMAKLSRLAEYEDHVLDLSYRDGEIKMTVKEGSKTVQAMFMDAKTLEEMKEMNVHVDLGISRAALGWEGTKASRVGVNGMKKEKKEKGGRKDVVIKGESAGETRNGAMAS